jgi:hypothetical protein
MSAIIGETGTISKSFIPGKHEIKKLEKTATLGTTQILRKILV